MHSNQAAAAHDSQARLLQVKPGTSNGESKSVAAKSNKDFSQENAV
jgi:hypothetical protein